MSYPLHTFKEMKNLIHDLDKLYQRKERQMSVKMLKALMLLPHMNAEVMLGAFLSVIQEIRFKEYYGKCPIKNKYFGGSSLCSILAEKLKLGDALNDDENLIYIFKYYRFIENIPERLLKEAGINKEKKDILVQQKFLLKKLIKRESARIHILAQGTPKLEALQKKINKLLPKYESATASRFFCNSKRANLLDFINLINDTLDIYKRETQQNDDEKSRNDSYFYEYNTRLGLILFILMRIAHEYKYLSPKRSELYTRCLAAINIKNIKDVPFENKELWLNALANHITNIKSLKQYQSIVKQWEKKDTRLDEFYFRLHEYIHIEEKTHTIPKSAYYISQATSTVAQYGTGFAITQLGKNYALAALGGVGGPIGIVIYSAAGTILMTQLGKLVADNIMPSAVSYVYVKVLEKIGNSIAKGTTSALRYTFSAGRKGINSLLGQSLINDQDRTFLLEWIDTLLNLPHDIVSLDEKEQIKYALGIENELDHGLLQDKLKTETSNFKFATLPAMPH